MFSTSCLAVIFGLKLLVFPNYTMCLTTDKFLIFFVTPNILLAPSGYDR